MQVIPYYLATILGLATGIISTTFKNPKDKILAVKENNHLQWISKFNKENAQMFTYAGKDGDYLLLNSINQKNVSTANTPEIMKVLEKEKYIEPVLNNRHAFVIGNNHYKNQSPILNAINDVNDVSKKLEEVGFNVMTYFIWTHINEKMK